MPEVGGLAGYMGLYFDYEGRDGFYEIYEKLLEK
jgi:hypothetical protein